MPPVYGKNNTRSGLANWQNLNDGLSPEQVEMWGITWPDAVNTGVLTHNVPTLDADILNPEAAVAVEDMVREHYEERGHLMVQIGLAPKRAYLFRTDEPFDKITINFAAEEKLEFLCDGQQVVVDGIHPDTHKPYAWFGGEPGPVTREELPSITRDEAGELMERAAEILVSEFGYERAGARPRKEDCNGARAGGTADWGFLVENIRNGEALHDSLRDLAAKLVTAGMEPGAAVNFLRGLMNSHPAELRDGRWQERYDDIPRLVDSARKFSPYVDSSRSFHQPQQRL